MTIASSPSPFPKGSPSPPNEPVPEAPALQPAAGRRSASLGSALCRLAYRGRALVFIGPLALGSLLLPRIASPRASPWLVACGLVVLGWSGRIWSQIHLGYRLPVRMSLTTCGPYRFLRNPIYCANTCVIAGAVIAFGYWWALPITVLWCAGLYSAATRHEEARLRAWHGRAYCTYCHEVARWLPSIGPPAGRCSHRLSPRSLLAEVQVPVVLVPAGVKTFGLPILTAGSAWVRLLMHGRAWL
jgi:protein-S-isoprenylcysteine O-methyltransferase Ste14